MTDEGRDPAIERIAEALRPLPAVDESAKARVLVAIAAERARATEGTRKGTGRAARWRWLGAGLAAAGVIVVFFMATRRREGAVDAVDAARVAAVPTAAAPVAPVMLSADAGDNAASVPVQLVLRAPSARHVAVVGDFTGWDDARVAMERDPASGLWSATVHVRPGRHVYAFVADDTVWLRDPRAPLATDPDFGRPGSLLLVGKP